MSENKNVKQQAACACRPHVTDKNDEGCKATQELETEIEVIDLTINQELIDNPPTVDLTGDAITPPFMAREAPATPPPVNRKRKCPDAPARPKRTPANHERLCEALKKALPCHLGQWVSDYESMGATQEACDKIIKGIEQTAEMHKKMAKNKAKIAGRIGRVNNEIAALHEIGFATYTSRNADLPVSLGLTTAPVEIRLEGKPHEEISGFDEIGVPIYVIKNVDEENL